MAVEAAARIELRVCSLLCDRAVIKNDDLIAIHDCRDSVCNDNARTALSRLARGLLNQKFRVRVDVRRGFIEDQDVGIECENSSKGDQLAFAEAEIRSTLFDFRLKPSGVARHELSEPSTGGRIFNSCF